MHCIVTAGPTHESLDAVRRLTNHSTGRLGTELANHLTGRGHTVTLLLGEQATWAGARLAARVLRFGSTVSLGEQLQTLGTTAVDAVFHAAAVSDFCFGKVWHRRADGALEEIAGGKLSSREGVLLAELQPTPKLLNSLRDWFPTARLVGWKFEVDGTRETALAAARRQLADAHTDACVANGPAWGEGFGLVQADASCEECVSREALFAALDGWLA